MSFKLALDVGDFDLGTRDVFRPVGADAVRQMIVQAGGRLLEDDHPDVVKRRKLAASFAARGRLVLGFLGPEFVILHEGGYLMLAAGGGSNLSLLAFLRMIVADGCTIWTEDGEATERTLKQFADFEERFAELSNKERTCTAAS